MSFAIAIDGPAGAGKSTIAKNVAKTLGAVYVDTGAMYRAMGIYLISCGILPDDREGMAARCTEPEITIAYEDGRQQVFLNGENVTGSLRTEEVGNMASICSAVPEVRKALLALQRNLAKTNDVVMDGRDIGTVILPDAEVKIFLTASPEIRAKRRFDELTERGVDCDYDVILSEIRERDERDSTRAEAPLKQAEDAVLVDSSDLGIDEVTDRVIGIAKEKGITA